MAPRPSIAGECEAPVPLSARIEIVVVIEDPQRIDPRRLGVAPLLPVEPPKVDTLIFEGVMQDLKVVFHKAWLGALKGDRLFFSARVDDQGVTFLLVGSRPSALHIAS